uniref:Uncharacterized protein n=1 Tax=Podoviridae sp. ctG4L18 TaxID=2825234 RepID=A0A8S5UP88_9CAUD|nr:MAG TPA: hypothetical protein [Podoviridae sp. ctG4L18]
MMFRHSLEDKYLQMKLDLIQNGLTRLLRKSLKSQAKSLQEKDRLLRCILKIIITNLFLIRLQRA